MKSLLVVLLFTAAARIGAQTDPPAPEDIVRRYVQAWNADDLDTFLALSPSSTTYKPAADPDRLVGEASPRDPALRRQTYQALFARQPRVRVEMLDTLQYGDLVVSREQIRGLPDGKTGGELTIYQVKDGLIRNVWHLRRTEK